jgi:hypothetical protein
MVVPLQHSPPLSNHGLGDCGFAELAAAAPGGRSLVQSLVRERERVEREAYPRSVLALKPSWGGLPLSCGACTSLPACILPGKIAIRLFVRRLFPRSIGTKKHAGAGVGASLAYLLMSVLSVAMVCAGVVCCQVFPSPPLVPLAPVGCAICQSGLGLSERDDACNARRAHDTVGQNLVASA